MKNYNEMAEHIFERRAKYQAQKRNQMQKAMILLPCICLIAVFGVWQSGILGAGSTQLPDDISENLLLNASNEPVQTIKANINEIASPDPVMTAQIALLWEDFVPMDYDELLKYYDISLPIGEIVPTLYHLQPQNDQGYGIFQTDERGVYYDGNTVSFQNQDGTQELHITLSKAFHHVYDIFTLTGDEIGFTEINGRNLAIFRFRDGDDDCYYVEFLQGGIGWYVESRNLSQEDFLNLLQAVVKEGTSTEGDSYTVQGIITLVDHYANFIGIRINDTHSLTIRLPKSDTATDYSFGTEVMLIYTGEPVTIGNIWPQQIVDIAIIE